MAGAAEHSALTGAILKGTATNYLRVAVKLVKTVMLTRILQYHLGVDFYGYWTLLWAVFGYAMLLELGFGRTMQKYTAEGVDTPERLLSFNRIFSAVLASYLGIALALTCPIVFTVCYLGDPDAGPVVTGYAGSFLLAGAYLAISGMTSAFTRNQIVSFITSTVLCLLLVLIGFPPVTDLLLKWGAPAGVLDFSADLSVFYHFTGMQRGVFDLRDIVYFLSLMVLALAVTGIALKNRRG